MRLLKKKLNSRLDFPKVNNFDSLRLLAALQVAVVHGYEHFKLLGDSVILDYLINILKLFPGVIVFFSLSGFLIFASFDKNSALKRYVINRFLRLYPGLFFSFALTLSVLFFLGFFNSNQFFSKQGLFWLFGQLTFLQFYTPDFLRPYGLGNPNGSLWTIVIEIQFYFIVPLLFIIIKKFRERINYFLFLIFFLSLLFNLFLDTFILKETIIYKLLCVSIFPYLLYFVMGALIYFNYNFLGKYLNKNSFFILIAYILICYFLSYNLHLFKMSYWPNSISLIMIVFLIWLIFTFAFKEESLLTKLLNKNDYSYGLYIYHGIVLNFLIELELDFTIKLFVFYLIISSSLAFFSWRYIESFFLKFKFYTLK